jgi:hypothetical protein
MAGLRPLVLIWPLPSLWGMEAEGRGYFVWTSVFAEEEKN